VRHRHSSDADRESIFLQLHREHVYEVSYNYDKRKSQIQIEHTGNNKEVFYRFAPKRSFFFIYSFSESGGIEK